MNQEIERFLFVSQIGEREMNLADDAGVCCNAVTLKH